MRTPSLKQRLALFWILTLCVTLALDVLLYAIYNEGAGAQIRAGTELTRAACAELRVQFTDSLQGGDILPADKTRSRELCSK